MVGFGFFVRCSRWTQFHTRPPQPHQIHASASPLWLGRCSHDCRERRVWWRCHRRARRLAEATVYSAPDLAQVWRRSLDRTLQVIEKYSFPGVTRRGGVWSHPVSGCSGHPDFLHGSHPVERDSWFESVHMKDGLLCWPRVYLCALAFDVLATIGLAGLRLKILLPDHP